MRTTQTPSAASGRPTSARGSRRWAGFAVAGALLVAGGAWFAFRTWNGPVSVAAEDQPRWDIPAEFDADRAFSYLQTIVDFGPRPSGSAAMQRQQQYLERFFEEAGAEVEMQSFDARHPETGERVVMKNVIARFRPHAPRRYLLCAHYDTRPYPDRDPENPKGVFVGANDGGSGTAALMEMAHHIERLPPNLGIDIVLFDGEELVVDGSRDPYFLGSIHFSKEYAAAQASQAKDTAPPYVAGVLLDMVGDRELQLFYERNSWNYAHDVTVGIWSTARRLGIDAFQPRLRHVVKDDHIPLNTIAKIPTTDVIDFDYPRPGFRYQSYWHTTQDTIDKCSGQSMVAVIYVVHTWLASKG